ncbi:MAG: AGE family epimerase/isomerase [Rhizobiaceae bacterium]|nr:AGE family epimerase/isomerase [Rhizobiaceae bacterium]
MLKSTNRPELDDGPKGFDFKQNAEHLTAWLDTTVLPLWWSLGFNRKDLIWREGLTLKGKPISNDCRARVQGRQAYVFASAGKFGWEGPWREAVVASIRGIEKHYLRDDGLLRTLVSAQGNSLNNSAYIHDQTFVLLALAATQQNASSGACMETTSQQLQNNRDEMEIATAPVGLTAKNDQATFSTESNLLGMSEILLTRIETAFGRKAIDGNRGFRETGSHAYQSNAHMHLLEAALLWLEVSDEQGLDGQRWNELCVEITSLAIDCFIDSKDGFIREFFDENWEPAPGANGQIVEPGHQFEWAWLFVRWFKYCGDKTYLKAAKRLFAAGVKGIDPVTNAAVDTMNNRLEPTTRQARLWQQTEWLKASLVLHEEADKKDREYYLEHIIRSHETFLRYLNTDTLGVWYDKLQPEEGFLHEISPASSLYHISSAIRQLQIVS